MHRKPNNKIVELEGKALLIFPLASSLKQSNPSPAVILNARTPKKIYFTGYLSLLKKGR